MEWANVVRDGADQDAHPDEGDEERDRGNKHALTGPVGDGGTDDESEAGEMQQDEEEGDDEGGKGQ
jgi:hypothetical protein